MKVFELEARLRGSLVITELDGVKLPEGQRILVAETFMVHLEKYLPVLPVVGTHEMESLKHGHWGLAGAVKEETKVEPKTEEVDLAKVARNTSMAGKPGKRLKGATGKEIPLG